MMRIPAKRKSERRVPTNYIIEWDENDNVVLPKKEVKKDKKIY